MSPPVFLCVFSLLLLSTACNSDQSVDQGESKTPAGAKEGGAEPKKVAGAAVVHDVMCGCSIDGVGRCGNYIMIDGKYVPMIHPGLGKMEWCAEKANGAKVETVGAMKDGKFVAESWKTIE